MAVGITLRPITWSPVLNPVIYKFTFSAGPFTNWYVRVSVFRAIDNVQISNAISKDYYKGVGATINVDISQVLSNYLSKDTGSLVGVSEDQVTSVEYYIKFQEFYTGSATALISDIANPLIGILAGMEIGSSGDMSSYIGRFINKMIRPKLWRGYDFSLSFIETNAISQYTIDQFDVTGSLLATASGSTGSTLKSVNKLSILAASINAAAAYITAQLYKLIESVATSTWIDGSGGPRVGFTSKAGDIFTATAMVFNVVYSAYKAVLIPINQQGSGPLALNLNITTVNAGGRSISVQITYWTSAFSGIAYQASVIINTSASTNYAFNFLPSGLPKDIGIIEVYATYGSGGSGTPNIAISFPTGTDLWNVVDQKLFIDVENPCINPIYLKWKNVVGGDQYWLFDVNQDYTFAYLNGEKAPRKIGYVTGITADQWLALDELNTPGDILNVPITDSIALYNKTKFKVDQQVYAIDSAGNKIGVVIIARPSLTQTKKYKHLFQVELELPTLTI